MKGILAKLLGIAFLVGAVLVLTVPCEMHRMASRSSSCR